MGASDLADLVPGLYSASAGAERVIELLDEAAAADRPGATALPAGPGELELSGVHVTYPGATRAALKGLDLRIGAGEHVAVVGASGSGKSTLARLLTRQLAADSGTVRIDGHDVLDHTTPSVRAAVTVVLQEQHLIDASVHDNIAFARPGATRDDVRRAALLADADEFVSRLPDGYDTRVGQRGRSLSGGQRQRIALARALLRDSPVLVLDEPTTGLDEQSSRRLMTALTESARGRTVVVLTHDPVPLDYVDRVVRLDDQPVTAGAPA